jgi:hypothetical protein
VTSAAGAEPRRAPPQPAVKVSSPVRQLNNVVLGGATPSLGDAPFTPSYKPRSTASGGAGCCWRKPTHHPHRSRCRTRARVRRNVWSSRSSIKSAGGGRQRLGGSISAAGCWCSRRAALPGQGRHRQLQPRGPAAAGRRAHRGGEGRGLRALRRRRARGGHQLHQQEERRTRRHQPAGPHGRLLQRLSGFRLARLEGGRGGFNVYGGYRTHDGSTSTRRTPDRRPARQVVEQRGNADVRIER